MSDGALRLEFKVCATCRNLEVTSEGQEFPGIADTVYSVFHCKVYNWTTREDYLMAPIPIEGQELPLDPFNCPSWEEFRPE